MMRPPLPRLIQEEISLTMLNRLGKETVPDAWLADLAEDSYYRTGRKILGPTYLYLSVARIRYGFLWTRVH